MTKNTLFGLRFLNSKLTAEDDLQFTNLISVLEVMLNYGLYIYPPDNSLSVERLTTHGKKDLKM